MNIKKKIRLFKQADSLLKRKLSSFLCIFLERETNSAPKYLSSFFCLINHTVRMGTLWLNIIQQALEAGQGYICQDRLGEFSF